MLAQFNIQKTIKPPSPNLLKKSETRIVRSRIKYCLLDSKVDFESKI